MRRTSSRFRSRARTLAKASELALAAPQVVGLRMLGALAAGTKPTAYERQEWTRMGTEKVDAFARSIAAMNGQWLRSSFELPLVLMGQWWSFWLSASTTLPLGRSMRNRALERHWQRSMWRAFDSGLAPVHRTAVANLRRLGAKAR